MNMVNPLAAVREGYDFAQGLRDRRTLNTAGNALSQGDYRGGANALMQGGMIDQGLGVVSYDQRNQQADAQAQRQAAEAQMVEKKRQAGLLLQGAEALRQLPEAQRLGYMQSTILPVLVQQGLDQSPEGQQIIAHIMQGGLTDQQLDSFITAYGGELQKPEWQVVNLGNGGGVIAVDQGNPGNRQVIEPPNRQARVIEAQDGLWQEQADGSWKKVATFAPQAKTFAPKGGGRGKAGGAAPRGTAGLPPGFELE